MTYFFSFLWASVTKPCTNILLFLLMLDWKSVCFSNKSRKIVVIGWSTLVVGLVKLNFDECSLGNFGQIGIGGMIRAYSNMVLRAFFK